MAHIQQRECPRDEMFCCGRVASTITDIGGLISLHDTENRVVIFPVIILYYFSFLRIFFFITQSPHMFSCVGLNNVFVWICVCLSPSKKLQGL